MVAADISEGDCCPELIPPGSAEAYLSETQSATGTTFIQEIAYHKSTIWPATHGPRSLRLPRPDPNLSFILVKRRKVAHVRQLVLRVSRVDLLLGDSIPPLIDSTAIKPIECRYNYIPESKYSKRGTEPSRVTSCSVRRCLTGISATHELPWRCKCKILELHRLRPRRTQWRSMRLSLSVQQC